jgi:hypothetical protein
MPFTLWVIVDTVEAISKALNPFFKSKGKIVSKQMKYVQKCEKEGPGGFHIWFGSLSKNGPGPTPRQPPPFPES